MNWKDTVTDPEEVKVFLALDGPNYTWRTMSGIARQAGLSEERVAAILKKYNLRRSRACPKHLRFPVRLWSA